MKPSRVFRITSKVNLILIIALVAGIGSISFIFNNRFSRNIDRAIDATLLQQSDLLFRAIENFMMPGQAELAVDFFQSVRQGGNQVVVNLFRRFSDTPQLAFSDNTTVTDVVARVPALRSMFSDTAERMVSEVPVIREYFEVATGSPPVSVTFETTEADDEIFARVYRPLINLPKCTDCHGADHTVRGVLDIRTNITESRQRQMDSTILSGSLFLGMVILLTIILSAFLRRSIIRPVKRIGAICSGVTQGDFDSRVSIRNRDEIGVLGETVNTMVEGLHERFELSKYVSSSTLQSLRGDKEGRRVPITLLFSDIRGFTAYTEKQDAERVVRYLNEVLNFQSEIIQAESGDIDKYVGDEIVAMFTDENQELGACRAAWKIQQISMAESDAKHDGLKVGIGINTGEVILGQIGSERRADFTFIGDNVNSASRLCDAAEPNQILLAASTYEKVKGQVEVDGPFKLKAKGKDEYLRVYILTGISEGAEE